MSCLHSFAGLIDFQDGFAKESAGKEGGKYEDDALGFSEKDGPPTKSKMLTSPRRKKVMTRLPDDDDDSESFVGVQGEKRLTALLADWGESKYSWELNYLWNRGKYQK